MGDVFNSGNSQYMLIVTGFEKPQKATVKEGNRSFTKTEEHLYLDSLTNEKVTLERQVKEIKRRVT